MPETTDVLPGDRPALWPILRAVAEAGDTFCWPTDIAEGRARAEGYRAMQFNAVVATNTGAVALWRSLGFRVLATVPEAFRHPTDGLVGLHLMHLAL